MGIQFSEQRGRKKKRLGDILVSEGVITPEQLDEALQKQRTMVGKKLGVVLVELGMSSEDEIVTALQRQLSLDRVRLSEIKIPEEILKLVREDILRKNTLLPFAFSIENMNVLRVAMADPLDIVAVDDLAILTNFQIEPVIATPRDITTAIDKYFGNTEAMKVAEKFVKERKEQFAERRKEEEEANADVSNAPVVQLVNKIIEQAARQRSSDIHIEALEDHVRVRFRIDGVLKKTMEYDIALLNAIVARIKIIGGMDISEKRKPQDGRITSVVDNVEYDIRVSVLPTVYGEKVVMRLTQKKALNRDKKDLGLAPDELVQFDRILQHPHGIILVTGPTGSGKSTTLYTALSELNTEDVNIITVEDPVEANVDGINQVQVNNKADMTFANALRSILRQDPDIIMIGEIRDNETAEIAVKASITGHLVVSTLHTNSSASTITRLEDMGVEPYLIADSVIGVIAQRLVRRLCPKCKKSRMATEVELEALGLPEDQEAVVYEPVGCHMCNNTGYYGRIGVYEIMEITPELKEIISKHGNANEIKEVALQQGMRTLHMSAAKYVLSGVT
ncbi:MAG: Flp pilus assembly complex ATPase component TadA, partial [Lachnospiraceae bacterium]|nr:Flp pilus assembly complex ATPase component TadA [Lachnospiraceae bacterium]